MTAEHGISGLTKQPQIQEGQSYGRANQDDEIPQFRDGVQARDNRAYRD